MALHLHRKNEYNPDLGDDVHESRIGGFLVSKYLDVEGSQQQGGRQMQQSRQEAQRTHPTHPGAKEMFTMLIDCEHVTVTAHYNNNNIEYLSLKGSLYCCVSQRLMQHLQPWTHASRLPLPTGCNSEWFLAEGILGKSLLQQENLH